VQDEGSQLVALALARASLDGPDSLSWLDLCAGPGGKSALLGGLVALEGGRLDAVEPAAHRAELVRRAVDGLPVTVHVADGRDAPLPDAAFDRVLVDAPCTGLGALRRRPESRWRRRPPPRRVTAATTPTVSARCGEHVTLAEAKQPQEGAQRGRGADPGEQPAHPAVAQQVHIADRVRAGNHPGDQGEDLRGGVRGDREALGEHRGQPAPIGKRHHRHQPRTGHEVRIVEPRLDRAASVR
jgi:hypothetical protein